jgi:hypothetical protein
MKNRCKVLKTTYKVDEANKTVVCIINWDMQPEKSPIPFWVFTEAKCNQDLTTNTSVGISKCHPDDTFDVVKGKRIAESKAKAKMYKKAYKVWDKVMIYLMRKWVSDVAKRKNACNIAYFNEIDHIEKLDK